MLGTFFRHSAFARPFLATALRGLFEDVLRAAVLAAITIGAGSGKSCEAADLPRQPPRGAVSHRQRPSHYVVIPAPLPEVYPAPPLPIAPGPPPSTHGYYGYYGFDIAGTPYAGLYSENVLCLRSIATPYGYRTVDICR